MGITGLLPFLKGIQRDVHVSSFSGRKVAVDSYCWLHRGAYSCALQLVMKTEKLETLPFIKYCMKRVNMLLKYDITPIMVFDGGYLPLKAATEKNRRERRQVNREKGKALLKEGRKSAAVDCFQKSVDVSPEMALALIKECRSAGVECIVAPYEADAQLAYLSKEGIVDLVITEDSDLLVFGCAKVLFKFDDSGKGKLVDIDQLGKANKGLVGFTIDSFRHVCILSGCDYLASVPGIGLSKALKLMKRFNKDPYRAIRGLHYETGKVPKSYEADFSKADQTFLYQMVFDPRSQQQVRLNPLPSDIDATDFEFAGTQSSPRKAVGMARGNINPLNHAVMDTYSPSKAPPLAKTKSWGGSVLGGEAGWGRPVNAQPPSALLSSSSDSARKHFKPPKKLKPKPVIQDEEDGVKDEDLQAMYQTASMTTAAHSTTDNTTTVATMEAATEQLKSKFFSSPSRERAASMSDETPPDDDDVASKLRARRRLTLMPQTTGNGGLRVSVSPSACDTELETPTRVVGDVTPPPGLGRKRPGSFDKEHSTRAKLQGFEYASSKKPKHTTSSALPVLSQLDQDIPPSQVRGCTTTDVQSSPRRNPFAKTLLCQRNSKSPLGASQDSVARGEIDTEPLRLSQNHGSVDAVDETSVTRMMPTNDTSTLSSEPRQRSFMTSEDFITTCPPRSSLLEQVNGLAQSSNGQNNLGRPTFTSQKRLSLLGNAGKRQRRSKGVSRSSIHSKFKAPKQSSELGQTKLDLLGQFGYTSRPRMSREQ